LQSTRRLVAVLSILALASVACTDKKNDEEVTPEPTDRTSVEQVAEFQLVGKIEKAFASIEPSLELPDDDVTVSGPTTDPSATPVGDSPSVPGVMRLNVEDVNEDLTDECGVAEGQDVRIYWTTDTSFDPSDVLEDIENEIEDQVAGVSGRVYRTADDTIDFDTPEPDETDEPTEEPDLTDASPFAIGSPSTDGDTPAADTSCVLVAEQVGFEQETAPATRRPAPTGRVFEPTPTKRPEQTDEPTAEPDETDKPKKTPLSSATPTAEQE
jgi:hypothetical protein